jgi:hypothetical protein
MKKIKFLLEKYDGVWSVPLAFFAFWFIGVVLQFFSITAGSYDLAFIQPLFLATSVVIGAVNIAIAGLFFNFRGLYRYLYGYKNENGAVINESKNDFKNLQPWQRFFIALFPLFFLVALIAIVYMKLI